MKNKITISLIAVTIITAFAFTLKTKHDTIYNVDTKGTTATWLGKKVTGQHTDVPHFT